MPELPEVESVRQSLEPIVGARVKRVRVRTRRVLVVPGDPVGGFSRSSSGARPKPVRRGALLDGSRIARLERHGKQLAVLSDTGPALGIHLGMTGRVLIVAADDRTPARAHDHVVWTLDDGRGVVFNDARRFGGVWAYADEAALRERWSALGPDALTIDGPALRARLARTTRAIKGALLDQGVLAGVGNIYADESLHAARIHPELRADRLRPDDAERLAAALRAILGHAVQAGGSTLADGTYTDADGQAGSYATRHAVYGRGGQACRVCGSVLRSGTLAQRTTVWCPRCQRAPRRA
ncbi:MAG: formamidopyrimidine-DNA glycosylase [Phycisphaeraceae bacterium]|nr:MAG: formamidopyrimidine-DNA glycosylase [Phycisphaeraceae bacterium]